MLARDHPDDKLMQVSHETIYQRLYVQTVVSCVPICTSACPQAGRTQDLAGIPNGAGKFNDVITISQRPAEAADRAVPGHWEGDLIMGAEATAARSAHWSSAAPGSPSCCTCPTITPPKRWPPR